MRYVLAIDVGTGGPKVALVGEDGRSAAQTSRAVETRVVPPLGAEQDPEEIWQAVLSAARQVVHEAGAPREAIAGVMCASQYFSVVPVDASGHAVTPLLLWLDRRGEKHARALLAAHPEAIGTWIEIHGAAPFGTDSLSKILHVREERPDVYARTHKFLEPVDFVNLRLTGSFSANACTVFPMLLTDNRAPGALAYHPELVALAGLDPAKLPDLVPVDARIGTLRAEVAGELGIARETPVFTGMNDTHAVTIGTGTFQPGQGGLNLGTTMQVLAQAERKAGDFENQILSMPSPIPGRYMTMAETGLAGKVLEHFLRNVVHASDALADHATDDPFARIDHAVLGEPAGSGGLLFLPWLSGSMAPRGNPRMRGGFLNISLETTRARMLRAVLEGVAYNLRWMTPAVEQFSGGPFADLWLSGGGATSDAWAQILADVHDRPIHQIAEPRHVNTRGIAFLAFHRLGLLGLDEIDRFRPVRHTYLPRPAHREVYDRLFARFLECYDRTLPVFEALNARGEQ